MQLTLESKKTSVYFIENTCPNISFIPSLKKVMNNYFFRAKEIQDGLVLNAIIPNLIEKKQLIWKKSLFMDS